MTNFDDKIERKNTGSIKWDKPKIEYRCDDMIPMWVADMDFAIAPEIIEALRNRLDHPVFGYQRVDDSYKQAFVKHFNNRCSHTIKKEHIIFSTGVVYSMNACVQLLTKKKDKIIIHSPAYPPFRSIIERNERIVVDSKMIIKNGRYEFDFDDLERKVDDNCKLFMLCNPQNPTGRVFDKDELERIADFAQRHNLIIISDEIHADFIFDQKQFIPIVDINEYTKNNTITCVSCTKSFNLAALNVSAIFIKNQDLYERVSEFTSLNGLQSINTFGLEAMKTAYEKSEYWLDKLVLYLQANRDYAYEFLKCNLPKIKFIKQEATYLMWLDISEYNDEQIQRNLAKYAKVYTNDGSTFGKDFNKFVRLNIACPRKQLENALKAINEYLNKR